MHARTELASIKTNGSKVLVNRPSKPNRLAIPPLQSDFMCVRGLLG